MGQSLFFPQQAAAAAAAAAAADSAKDGSRPKTKTSRSPAEPAPPPEKPAAPAKPPDPPKKSQSPAPPPRPISAVTPPLPQERSSVLAPVWPSTSPDKPKSSSGTSLNPMAAPFQIKKDWRRPWGGAMGPVGEQPKPPAPSRASPAPGERQQGTARSAHAPPPPPSPLAEIAPQSGDKGKPMSAVPAFRAAHSFAPPGRTQDPVQAFKAPHSFAPPGRTQDLVQAFKAPHSFAPTGRTQDPVQAFKAPHSFAPPGRTQDPVQAFKAPHSFAPTGRTQDPVQAFKAPHSFAPPGRTQDSVQARFQFGKNQEFNPFLASLQSQSTVRKSIDAEERFLKSNTDKTLKTASPTKSVSQTSALPVPSVKASATGTASATSVEKQSPSKTSVKQASVQAAKPATAPSPPATEQNSFQLLISSAAGAQGPQGSQAGAAQTFSMSVAQKGAGQSVSSAERERRVKRLRKRQSELARRGKVLSGGETRQDTQAADNAKQRPENSPDLRIQGASPAFSTPPTRPAPTPPALFTFSSNVRKPELKPASDVAKGFGAPAHSQFSSTGPGQPKFSFSFGTSSSPKPLKLGQTPSVSSLPPVQQIRSGALGWSSTTINSTTTTNSSPSADPTHAPQKVRMSPVTPLKAKRKVHLKGATSVAVAQHKQENDEETREQGSPASATSPPKPVAHSPGSAPPPASPASPDASAKPKKKIRFKIPIDLGKSETNAGAANRVEKKEKKEKSKEAIPTFPASPPSPECPHRPSGGWPPFTAEQGCSRKARCRHQSGTELPRNVTRWLNVRPNYLCEPPWVTTATLAASVALILRQDGTYNQQ